MKPKIFVGSSTEGLDFAHTIQEELNNDSDIVVWDEVFDEYLNYGTLQSLCEFKDSFDFAIFIMTPDDSITIRGENKVVARDNIIFELGLFIGTLGLDRCFYIYPRNIKNLHLPTDLLGNNALNYGSSNWKKRNGIGTALRPACQKIQKVIDKKGINRKRYRATIYDMCHDAPGFEVLLKEAKAEFFSIGPSLQYVAQNKMDCVFQHAEENKDLRIRLLIMGPDLNAANLMNEYASGSSFIPERNHSHELFFKWQKEATLNGLNISIKVAPGIIPISINIVDPQLQEGKMLVIPFPYKTSGTERACFLVNKIDNPKCVNHYTEKFNLLWDKSVDITSIK